MKARRHFLRVILLIAFATVSGTAQTPTTKSPADLILDEALNLQRQGTAAAFKTAKEKYLEAARLYQAEGNRHREAVALVGAAYAARHLGQIPESLEFLTRAQPVFKTAGDAYWQAVTLQNVCVIHDISGDAPKVVETCGEALSLFRSANDQQGAATTLSAIGKAHTDMGDPRTALSYLKQAYEIALAAKDLRAQANALNSMGRAYDDLDEKKTALDGYTQALALARSVNDRTGEATILDNLGRLYFSLGETSKARERYAAALVMFAILDDKRGRARVLNNLALVASTEGSKEKALAWLKESETVSRAIGDKLQQAKTLSNIANIYSDLGERKAALDAYSEVLALVRSLKSRSSEAITLNNIGRVHSDFGDYPLALDYYNQSLSLRRLSGDKGGEATTLHNIAGVQNALGRIEDAVKNYTQALSLKRSVGDRSGQAATLNNMCLLLVDLRSSQKAAEACNQALFLRRIVGDKHGEAVTLNNLMYVWESLNNHRTAIFYGKTSINLLQTLRGNIRGLDSEIQKSFLGTVESTYRKLAELLLKENRIAEAEQVLRLLKDEEYFEFTRRDAAMASALDERIRLSPAEVRASVAYSKVLDEMRRTADEIDRSRKAGARDDEKLNAALARLISDSYNLKLILDNLTAARFEEAALNQPEYSSQAIVKSWADPGTAVVSTIVGADYLSLIVTTGDFQRAYSTKLSEAALKKLVDDYRSALTQRKDVGPSGQKLYDVLVGPLEKDLSAADARTLVWSLDKFLRYVPISALWDKNKGFVAERYATVVLAAASRQNLALRPQNKAEWQALGVGVSKAAGELEALANVPVELRAIVGDSTVQRKPGQAAGIFNGLQLLDEQFTLAEFRRSLGKYAFAHAATHFVFISGTKAEGLQSYLLLGGGEKLTLAQVQSAENLFAKTELLTLSACDTGYGEKTADGREIEGLGVLAQRKGARAIMATLWRVNDESTSRFMVDFYGRYKEPSQTKAEALRQAQLAMLGGRNSGQNKTAADRFAHPYYWSPFILIGNWR